MGGGDLQAGDRIEIDGFKDSPAKGMPGQIPSYAFLKDSDACPSHLKLSVEEGSEGEGLKEAVGDVGIGLGQHPSNKACRIPNLDVQAICPPIVRSRDRHYKCMHKMMGRGEGILESKILSPPTHFPAGQVVPSTAGIRGCD